MGDIGKSVIEDDLKHILLNPRESLGVELKSWVDPLSKEGRAKIARACIALWNNNGGVLVVGVQDSGRYDEDNRPENVAEVFTADAIQEIVTKHSSIAFEVQVIVAGPELGDCVLVRVPSGVTTPAACKSGIAGLIEDDAIYVRSLEANNVVSSSQARRRDWDGLVKRCFDNRESDIGAFVRRHMTPSAISELSRAVADLQIGDALPGQAATDYQDRCRERHLAALVDSGQSVDALPAAMEISGVVDGEAPRRRGSRAWLQQLSTSKPRHSGRPMWSVESSSGRRSSEPRQLDGGWEALIKAPGSMGRPARHEYWRLEPNGRYYHYQALVDDLGGLAAPEAGVTLDFYAQLADTAEALSIMKSFALAEGYPSEAARLCVAASWTGLKGRQLASWVVPSRGLSISGRCFQDLVHSSVKLPLESATASLGAYVDELVAPLFVAFDGMEFDSGVVDGIVGEVLARRM